VGVYFLDSSALVKRYVVEPGTAWVQKLFLPSNNNRISAALISGAEVVAAVARRHRAHAIAGVDAARMILEFRADFFSDIGVIEIPPELIDEAMQLAERHALRGYDAVQLAAALAVQRHSYAAGLGLTLVSADRDLNAAATNEGLITEDPNNHP
jgi:predicted nucleic acid-binding protein